MKFVSKKFATLFFCLFAVQALAETQWRIGVNIASYHIQPTVEFNEVNPGIFVSVTFRAEKKLQFGIQAGTYKNSFNEQTDYLLTFANTQLFKLESSQIRGGIYVGFFEYPDIAEVARDYGWPTINNFVLALGPSLAWRFDNGVDLTVGFLPIFSKDSKGVFTFQTSIAF